MHPTSTHLARVVGSSTPLFALLVLARLQAAEGQPQCDVDSTSSKLFVPLVVYFFVTLLGLAGGGVYLARTGALGRVPCVRSGEPISTLHLAGVGIESSFVMREMEFDDGVVRERESWQINFKELRFGARIGVGNVGEVYRGSYRGRVVAIKKLLGTWYKDADMVERFREEILLMSTMNHQNVLMFIGAVLDTDAGNICLVTELCERGTMYDVLHSEEPLTWQRRLRMARDIALGMDYLHTKAGIIQRDLKSQNLFVTKGFDVKVADFGLSRQLAPGRMQTYCGTPATMAPEIVRQEEYTELADVFSFGIILWELLTREEPYPGCTGLGLAYAVATRGLRPPIPAYCPSEWAALMVRCWADDPASRPSFDEIQRILALMSRAYDTQLQASTKSLLPPPPTNLLGSPMMVGLPGPNGHAIHDLSGSVIITGTGVLEDELLSPSVSGTGGVPAPWVNTEGVVIVGRGRAHAAKPPHRMISFRSGSGANADGASDRATGEAVNVRPSFFTSLSRASGVSGQGSGTPGGADPAPLSLPGDKLARGSSQPSSLPTAALAGVTTSAQPPPQPPDRLSVLLERGSGILSGSMHALADSARGSLRLVVQAVSPSTQASIMDCTSGTVLQDDKRINSGTALVGTGTHPDEIRLTMPPPEHATSCNGTDNDHTVK